MRALGHPAELPADVEAIEPWHLHVEQGHVGALASRHLHRHGSIGGVDDLHVRVFEREANQIDNRGLIVGDQDSHHDRLSIARGVPR